MSRWCRHLFMLGCCLGLLPVLRAQHGDSTQLWKTFRHKELDRIESRIYDPGTRPDAASPPANPAAGGELHTSGTLSRGISIGNAQDMSVDSYLNLLMRGKLSDDLFLYAHISDRNIPLQVSATSQQLRAFDRIYISLDYLPAGKTSARLLAGDVDLLNRGTYFMKFSRQGMGLDMAVRHADTLSRRADEVRLAVSVAKGTFCRQRIEAKEGVQSGYRLTGKNGELQILVLSASEKVYVDGVLLRRGEDADYTIDYNLAEITFTPRCPITRDKRIVVEFEYSDLNYVRSLTHLQTAHQRRKWNFAFDFYNEQDMKHQSNQMELDAASLSFLKELGSGGSVYYPYADSVGFLPGEVLYRRTDTLVGGLRYDSVYVYSTRRDSTCYRLRFSYLGEGGGNYVAVQSGVNGQVYAWVAPVDGKPQGAYEPVLLLVTPRRLQMYSLRSEYSDGRTAFMAEAALSNNDANTFSKKDANPAGAAFRTRLQTQWRWGKGQHPWKLTPSLYYEGKAASFEAIDAYRDVEFVRNFNLSDTFSARKAEHFADASLLLESPRENTVQWHTTAFAVPVSEWSAVRHSLLLHERLRGFSFDADANLLRTQQTDYTTFFLKHKEVLTQKIAFLQAGVSEDMEWNRYLARPGDSLMAESKAYNEWACFVKPSDSLSGSLHYRLQYAQRSDWTVWEQSLQPQAHSRQLQAEMEWLKFRQHPLRFSFSYRTLSARDTSWLLQEAENTLLGSMNYQGRFADGAVLAGLYATLGSALEDRTEYTYLKVAAGQGAYQWIDYNGNGVEELDEFELAVYRDQADYVRVYTVAKQQEKVYATTWTQSLSLRPEAVWSQSRGWRRALAHFSNTSSFQSQLKKSREGVDGAASPMGTLLNPFVTDLSDSLFRSGNLQFSNVFSFNPSHPVYGMECSYTQNQNKYMTVNGFEFASEGCLRTSLRYRWLERLTTRAFYESRKNHASSVYLKSRNYDLEGNQTSFSLQYPCTQHLSLSLAYTYRSQYNTSGDERVFVNSVEADATWRMPKRGSLYAKFRYAGIRFHGVENTPVAYVMMEALSNGKNGIIDVSYQTRIGSSLQFDLSYEGRLCEGAPMRHTGTVTVKAVL